MINIVIDNIKTLLNSDLSSYRIGKDTGLDPSHINKYRKEKTKIENMSLKMAKLLHNYYEKIKKGS